LKQTNKQTNRKIIHRHKQTRSDKDKEIHMLKRLSYLHSQISIAEE